MGSLGAVAILFLTVEGVTIVLEAAEGFKEDSLFAGGSELWSSRLRFRGHGFRSTSGIGVTGEGMFGARYGATEGGWDSFGLLGEEFVLKGGEVCCDTGGDGRFGATPNAGVASGTVRGGFSRRARDASS